MRRSVHAAILILLASPLAFSQDAKKKVDESAECKWTIEEGDKFEFRWVYDENRSRKSGTGDLNEGHDKREVDAEISYKDVNQLKITLKKVTWSYGTQDFEITVVYTEGKEPVVTGKLKVDAKNASSTVARADADRVTAMMKKLADGEYGFSLAEKGRTIVTRDGAPCYGGQLTLLDRLYTHPLLGSGPVRVGQSSKDPLEVSNLPGGMVEINKIDSKVISVNEKGIQWRGALNVPIAKPSTSGQNLTGSFTYLGEWNYSRQEYLQSSKEESTFTKKIDAKGKDADFYRETGFHNYKQSLTIKKKPADPNAKKPEKKPDPPAPGEEKKPEPPEEKKE